MWDKITLYKFQRIDAINQRDIPEVDKTLFSVCEVFGLTEFQLDNMPVKKAAKLISKTEKIFLSPFNPKPVNWFGAYKVEYNPANITFGQYVELSYFLQSVKKDAPIRNGHYILASICNYPINRLSNSHPKKAAYFLKAPIQQVIGTISKFTENFNDFNSKFTGLFGLSDDTEEEVKQDKFNVRYGWTYSASVVAEYQRIPLNDVYKMNVKEVLNALSYLKEKAAYEERILKLK